MQGVASLRMATCTWECQESDITRSPFLSIGVNYTLTYARLRVNSFLFTLSHFCKISSTPRRLVKFKPSQMPTMPSAFKPMPPLEVSPEERRQLFASKQLNLYLMFIFLIFYCLLYFKLTLINYCLLSIFALHFTNQTCGQHKCLMHFFFPTVINRGLHARHLDKSQKILIILLGKKLTLWQIFSRS